MTKSNFLNHFDFDQAVQKVSAAFPDETARVAFVNLSAADAEKELAAIYARDMGATWAEASSLAAENALKNGFAHKSAFGGLSIMASRSNHFSDPLLGRDASDNKLAFFTFYHEFAHIIIVSKDSYMSSMDLFMRSVKLRQEGRHEELKTLDAMTDMMPKLEHEKLSVNLSEAQADVFSCIIGLRDGWMSLEDVKKLAAVRKEDGEYDTTHITHLALDALIADYKDGAFKNITFQQARDFAENHGKLFAAATRGLPLETRAEIAQERFKQTKQETRHKPKI